MTSEDWSRLKPLFDQAVELPAEARDALIEKVRAEDPSLAAHLAMLLEAEVSTDSSTQGDTPLLNLKQFVSSDEFFTASRVEAQLEQIGRYRIVKELGHGGMGTVYEATDPVIGRAIAIKTIRLENLGSSQMEFLRDRLFREARLAGQLSHPGIVIIHDVGEHGAAAYIAMELVNGPSLEQVLRQNQRLGYAQVLDILSQAAKALDYAHENGVIHRDVKPANIMMHEGRTVKIADFGIAKIAETVRTKDLNDHTTTSFLTQPGKVMGTPNYMSPEQMRAEPVTGRSDQFSLAVVGFRMLAGILPFRSDSVPGLVHEIVYGERPSIRQDNPKLPAQADQVFLRALAKSPQERFSTCAEFVDSLDQAMRAPHTEKKKPVAIPKDPKPASVPPPSATLSEFFRYRPLQLLAAGLVVILVGSIILYRSTAPPEISLPPAINDAEPDTKTAKTNPTGDPQPENGPPAATVTPAVSTPRPIKLAPPVVDYFHAEPPSVKPGERLNLVWNVLGATKVTIDHGIGPVVADAGRSITAPSASTTYRLTAEGKGGSTEARATVIVLSASPRPPSSTARVYNLSESAMNRRMEKQVAAIAPPNALNGLQSPTVHLSVLVDTHGNVTDIQFRSGNRALLDAARQAAAQYHYRPYVVNGVRTEISVKFNAEK